MHRAPNHSGMMQVLPDVMGGLFTGAQSSPAGLNKTRWAKIIDSAGEDPVRYAWEEQTFQALAPGENTSIGFVKADAGIVATTTLNPIVEPNLRVLEIGDYVLVQREYYDPMYDWVFSAIGGSGANGRNGESRGVSFAECLSATPTGGRFNAILRKLNPDGTLNAPASPTSIWLRDGNNAPALVLNDIYLCTLTGNTLGRPVYTLVDFNATVRKKDLTSSQNRTLYFEFGPNEKVTITRPVDADSRRTLIEYAGLDIVDLFTGTTYTDVWVLQFDSTPTAYNESLGDYEFTWNAGAHTLMVRLNGLTNSGQRFLTRCCNGQLSGMTLSHSNGLAKVLGTEDPVCDP